MTAHLVFQCMLTVSGSITEAFHFSQQKLRCHRTERVVWNSLPVILYDRPAMDSLRNV